MGESARDGIVIGGRVGRGDSCELRERGVTGISDIDLEPSAEAEELKDAAGEA